MPVKQKYKYKKVLMKYLIMIFAILINILTGKLYAQNNSNTEKCIPCEKLIALKIPNVKITEAITVNTGSSHYKISGIIGREIKFELLLPLE
jgi:ribosomal protein S4E